MTLKHYLKINYRASVARSYGNHIEQFRAAMVEVESANYSDVLSYIELLRMRGLHAKSLRNHLSAIKVFFDWLQTSGQREDHPCARLVLRDPVDRRLQLDGLYTSEQMSRWLDANRDRKRRVAAGLLVHQALMSGEAVRVQVADVDLLAGTIYVTGGGKTASRTLSLKASQVLELKDYLTKDRKGAKTKALLLTKTGLAVGAASLNKLVNAGIKEAEKLTPLRVRQSVIAGLLEAGHDVRIVQAFAGHKTATATEQYRVSGLKELAEAVRKLHPRG